MIHLQCCHFKSFWIMEREETWCYYITTIKYKIFILLVVISVRTFRMRWMKELQWYFDVLKVFGIQYMYMIQWRMKKSSKSISKSARYYASGSMWDPKLQKQAIDYASEKATPQAIIHKVGSEALNPMRDLILSTKLIDQILMVVLLIFHECIQWNCILIPIIQQILYDVMDLRFKNN